MHVTICSCKQTVYKYANMINGSGRGSSKTMGRQQLEVLNALDVAKTQLYHFTAIVVAGMGFFTDAYDHAAFSLIVSAAFDHAFHSPSYEQNAAASSARAPSLRDHLHVVPSQHRLLQPEPIPERRLLGNRVDPAGEDHERHRGGVQAQTLIALCSTVPGYWFTVAFIDIIGRFAIQMLGFFFMTVFMFAIAIPYDHWTKRHNRMGFVIMYALTFFFANFEPNATTFVVPAEIFLARLRSTCHGISAAAGKAGAIVGAYGFLYAVQNKDKTKTDAGFPPGIGVKNALIVLGVINFLGMICTLAVPEAKGKSLEEASQENMEES
ncbi:hypothetical protein SASPL_120405 [Salvia splendens]|uniref:MFS transporter, PHS family, inorganic phosphate transporter n=1 Tax=Salvia splendens TaxID=180675 RepID=A0A8X8XU76_SALSN|nr:hypothetical protein SASPL_120405 [Salvia splendens]